MADAEHRVIVRACRADELAEVLDLWRTVHRAAGETDDPRGLSALRELDASALLVAELDGRIVGSLIAAWDGWRGNMYRLTVLPDLWRQGIATRLVAAGDAHLEARGARRISALVREEDERVRRFWLFAGYEHDEGTGRYVKTITERGGRSRAPAGVASSRSRASRPPDYVPDGPV